MSETESTATPEAGESAAGESAKAKGGGKRKSGAKRAAEAVPAGPFIKRTAPARLRVKYDQEVRAALIKEFGYQNPMAAPRLVKIVLNMGLGEALQNPKLVESAEAQLGAISGQKPVVTLARKSIATYKLRQGQKIGCMVTLRRERMYEFLDRLVSVALPRTRDFRGVSPRGFDGRGNYTLGIKEQIVFPEIDYDKIEKIKGLNVSIITTAGTDAEGRALLRHLGVPFRS
ncbi:MAG: 50S ribosomal protein L5 [Proteobacteria bacterium]|nr:50S ribosomal protein L5 [Pseudomonadota bacterium]